MRNTLILVALVGLILAACNSDATPASFEEPKATNTPVISDPTSKPTLATPTRVATPTTVQPTPSYSQPSIRPTISVSGTPNDMVNERTYDINCMVPILGRVETDDIVDRGHNATTEQLAKIVGCKLRLQTSNNSQPKQPVITAQATQIMVQPKDLQIESGQRVISDSNYDPNCMVPILGRALTDNILYRGYPATADQITKIQSCKLITSTSTVKQDNQGKQIYDDQGRRIDGQGEETFDASGFTFNCSGGDKDEGGIPTTSDCNLIPPSLPAGVTKGTLLNVSLPQAKYQDPVGECQILDQEKCAELKWEQTTPLLTGEFVAIDISLTDPNVMYAGVDSNDMSMYRSVDGGSSWDLVHVAGHVGGVAISPVNPNNAIYTNLETANYQTLDGGSTWKRVLGNLPDEGEVAPSTAVAFSKDDPKIVYTAILDNLPGETSRGGNWPPVPSDIFRSADEGKSWIKMGACKTCGSVQTIVVVEGDLNFVWVAADGGLFFSRDGGGTWSDNVISRLDERIKEPESLKTGGLLPKVVGVAVQPGNPKTMLAASSEFGMFRSTDGGTNWIESNEGLTPARLHRVQFSISNPNIAYLTTHDGVFRSDDAGISWTERNRGLLDKYVNPIAIHPTDEDIVFVGTSNEMYTIHTRHQRRGLIEGGGIYKTVDGGKNWVRSDSGIIEAKTAQIGAHPIIPFNLWVGGESGRGNLFSPDGGNSWLFSGSMTAHYPMVYAFSYDFPTVMWTTGWQATGELTASTNGGANWYTRTQKLDEGLSAKTRELGLRGDGANDFHIHGVAVAPSDSSIIYVGSVHDSVYANLVFNLDGSHIFKSSDGGVTFPEMSDGFPIETETSINSIVVHPRDPNIAYVMTSLHETTTAIGIYKTTNGAQSWVAMNEGLDPYTNDLQMDPINPEVLYAASESGVFKTTNGATTWEKASNGIAKGAVIDMAMDPLNPLVLYAITPEDIYRTRDGAEHWYPVNLGIPLLEDTSKTLSVQDRLLKQLMLDRTKTGHSMYGGTFAQDRTLEIDATGRLIVVAAKTNRGDADKRNERIVYRAVLTPLVNVDYEFSIDDPQRNVSGATVKVTSQSNIYDMFFDSNKQELKFIVAGPSDTNSETVVVIPSSLLSGGDHALECCVNVFLDGNKIPSNSTSERITFEYAHTGRSEVIIKTK